MKRMLINATQLDEVRVAITDGNHLIDLDIEVPGYEQKKANIYKATISSIEPSLGVVFVNYGSEQRHGFLPLKEVSPEYFLTQDPEQLANPDINKVLRIGQPLVVQVQKEERGSKGAALTTFISLAGSFLVLMPNNPSAGGVSRRIEGKEQRTELRSAISSLNVPEGMGTIIRTAGLGKTKEELEWDLNILLRYWEAIKQAATVKAGPYLIHKESDVVIRGIRDYLRLDIEEIIIDDESAYQRAYKYISQIRPDFIPKLKLYKDSLPLFSRFQLEQKIETAYQREVRLPSGGSIVIDHTEALVAIDINSARATKGSNIEETALNTNLEAAVEIARQLRIRDIGGLVVIDFIDMTPSRNQREVENCLRDALHQDRARIQIGRISRFGLLEMSRQRIRSSLTRSSQISCPRCEGQGTVRSTESQAISIMHLIQEQAAKVKNLHFQVQLPLDVATFITNEKRDLVSEIEKICQVKISIVPNQFLESPHYQLKQLKCSDEHLAQGNGIPSYKLLKSFRSESTSTKKSAAKTSSDEPAITQFLSSMPAPAPVTKTSPASGGLIKRLWSKMFGGEAQTGESSNETPVKKTSTSDQRLDGGRRPHRQGDRQSGGHHHRPKQTTGHRQHTRRPHPSQQAPHGGQQGSNEQQQHHSNDNRPNRTRRGSRGGQQRSKTTELRHGDKEHKVATPGDITTRNRPPYPEDIDMVLPQTENPAISGSEAPRKKEQPTTEGTSLPEKKEPKGGHHTDDQ